MHRNNCMKVGDIVRKKLHNGTPIGPYMQIVEICGKTHVKCTVKGVHRVFYTLERKNLHVLKCFTLTVSEQKLFRLRNGDDICISHLATKTWLRVLNEKPDLVKIQCKPKYYTNVYSLDHVLEYRQFKEHLIKVIINEKIL